MDQTDIGNEFLESALEADLRQSASHALVCTKPALKRRKRTVLPRGASCMVTTAYIFFSSVAAGVVV
jgi:hypothetical protein